MKNQNLKKTFLETMDCRESTGRMVTTMLNNIGRIEDKLNKDFGLWNKKEMNDYLLSDESGSFATITGRLPYFKKYGQFFEIQTGYKNDYLLNINLDAVGEVIADKIRSESKDVLSFNDLVAMTMSFRNPRDRALVLGLYEGIMGKNFQEFIDIRPEDVKEDRIYIRSRGKDLLVSKELIEAFRDAMDEDTYYRGETRDRQEPLLYGDIIAMKIPASNIKHMHRAFRSNLKRLGEKMGVESLLNASSLRAWGEANYLLNKAKLEGISLETAYSNYRQEIMRRFDTSTLRRDILMDRVYELAKEEEIEQHEN